MPLTKENEKQALLAVRRIRDIQDELVELEKELKELGVDITDDEIDSPFMTESIWDLDVVLNRIIRNTP